MALQRYFRRRWKSYRAYLLANVAVDIFLEMELLMLAFATGILDVITFPEYHVFASNQTGNTALLAVGALGIGGGIVSLPHCAVSLSAFVAGGTLCGQLGNRIGCRKRIWLLSTNVFQTLFVLAAACLHMRTDHVPNKSLDLGIIALLAFASGGQVAFARTVNIPEITTAMVTSAYIDLGVDPELFCAKNRPRNRRIIFIGCMLLGSFAGAIGIAYHYVTPASALLLSAIFKGMMCVTLLFNPESIC
ncbi:hypothetical protein MMC12_003333 [Toensbergia leucococca]|nr:hypothetical protein [Toensbergia leucococca]